MEECIDLAEGVATGVEVVGGYLSDDHGDGRGGVWTGPQQAIEDGLLVPGP